MAGIEVSQMKKKKRGLATWIITGMVAGIITGLFLGEMCAGLKIVGIIFIQLLQMTILPYIIVALIIGIGSLSFSEARQLALRGGILLCIFWGLIIFTVLSMPIVFPEMTSASFFSTSMVQAPPVTDYLQLYIPSNPFSSMASSMVPAVVLFSLCLGVALIGVKKKQPLLDLLIIVKDALMKVAKAVVYLTPIGVFAFAANAAGTFTMEQFAQLQVFFVTYIATAIILTFILFPLAVSIFTPFTIKEIIGSSKDVLVTAFTTGNLFIVLPLISDRVKGLLAEREPPTKETEGLPDVVIPITFNFPDAGQLPFLLFILFASWFSGNLIPVSQYLDLASSGLMSFFGGANLAIPYLLHHFQLSLDYFQLYMVAGILNGYFATMAGAMNLICYAIICSYWMSGKTHFSLRRFVVNGSISLGVIILIFIGMKIYLLKTTSTTITQVSVLEGMTLKDPVKFTVDSKYPDQSLFEKIFEVKNSPERLSKIKNSKILKVGFNISAMPFVFKNNKGELVGYDVQMANNLARDLGCEIRFIPFKLDHLTAALENNVIDIAMSGIYIGLDRIADMDFTDSYMDINPAIIMRDHDKKKFSCLEDIQKFKILRVAILQGSMYTKKIENQLPNATPVFIDKYEDFFTGKVKADFLVHSAEQGYTWTLLYPQYSVVILKALKSKTMVGYAIAKGDLPFLNYLNYWLTIQKLNHVTEDNYKYWILGQVPELKKERWSIIRNVLHWKK